MKKIIFIIIVLVSVTALTRWANAAVSIKIADYDVSITQTLQDGATISVHFQPEEIKRYHPDFDKYTSMILQYAQEAYNTIVYEMGFKSPGFTYINPDKDYCHDKDKTIDIYIGNFETPCYDIIRGEGRDYDALILFPLDYEGYIKRWYGDFAVQGFSNRIKASIYHEMLHVITYSYNKNVEDWYSSSTKQGGDWYVEGLARYFETIAGSYNNFFAKGFVKEGADKKKIIFHGGVNYLMENPGESLKDARYDYALFWAYLHKKYGMEKIEEISRRFRFISKGGIARELPAIISLVLKDDFKDLIEGFAIALYFKHFNPDIKEGLSELKIMSLEDFHSRSPKKLSSWASNFITLNLDDKSIPGQIAIQKTEEDGLMSMNVFCRLESGRLAHLRKVALVDTENLCAVDLSEMKQIGVKEVILIITNVDAKSPMLYNLQKS